MNEPRVALDLEGVLADTHITVVEHCELGPDDFETWDFNDADFKVFMDTLEYVWDEHWEDIPPTERNIAEYVELIGGQYQVDIVTNTPGSRESVKSWLDMYGITYGSHDSFVNRLLIPGPNTHKEDLDYDIYIDDNPYLVGKVPLHYFVKTKWNDHLHSHNIAGGKKMTYYDLSKDDAMVINSIHEDRPTIVRVDSLGQVHSDLTFRNLEDAVAI